MINVESLIKISQYLFDGFDLLMSYVMIKLQPVKEIKNQSDVQKNDIIEEVLKLLASALKIDYMFLFSKGENVLLQFL